MHRASASHHGFASLRRLPMSERSIREISQAIIPPETDSRKKVESQNGMRTWSFYLRLLFALGAVHAFGNF